ncbi:hypothetical protein [Rhizobium herbae]|jgi:hypothetical protein
MLSLLIRARARIGAGCANLHRQLAWSRVFTAVMFALFATMAAIVIFRSLPTPQTFVVVQAESEFLEYRVFNPELATIHTAGFSVAAWPDGAREEGACFANGAFQPQANATIAYQRIETQPLQITVTGKANFRDENGKTESLDGETILYRNTDCVTPPTTTRMPVWGPGRVGSFFSMPSDGPGPILRSGTLEIFGRTLDLGMFGGGGAVYAATSEPLTIPPGGFIRSDAGAQNEEAIAPELTAFFGYINLTDEPGFEVRLTTDTTRLEITAPGARETASRIEIGLFAQALNDPNILKIQIFFLLLFLFLPICIDLTGLATSRDESTSTSTSQPSTMKDTA